MEKLAAVSVDLDEIGEYAAIHGLGEAAVERWHVVYDVAVPRLLRWARGLSIPLTLFVIARDLGRSENVAALRDAVAGGDEIGNHSLDHRYDLTRLAGDLQRAQVIGAQDRIEAALGVRPVGFRAPGYTMTDSLLSVLREAGLRYDASVFPCPSYYAAKLTKIGLLRARGTPSRSVIDDPRMLLAPTEPYRPSPRDFRRGCGPGAGSEVVEIPMRVVGRGRWPFIGTSLTLAPRPVFRALLGAATRAPTVSLELHGIDFLDRHDVGGRLPDVQPDLRVSVDEKLAHLTQTVNALRDAGFRFERLEALASAVP